MVVTLLIALMVVAAPSSTSVQLRPSDPLPAHRLNDWMQPSTYAWSDDGWALKLRYVVATNLDVMASARGNVELVRADWVAGILFARTDLRLRSFSALAAIDRGLAPDVLASSVVLGSEFALSTTWKFVPSIGVKFTASPSVLAIKDLDDLMHARKSPMLALVYVQIQPTR